VASSSSSNSRAAAGPVALPTAKRKIRSIEDEPDINLTDWIDAPAESEAGGGNAALPTTASGMASQPAQQQKVPKWTKLSGTNKGKQPDELDRNYIYYKRRLADTADPKDLCT
jgi:hypothetical protein